MKQLQQKMQLENDELRHTLNRVKEQKNALQELTRI